MLWGVRLAQSPLKMPGPPKQTQDSTGGPETKLSGDREGKVSIRADTPRADLKQHMKKAGDCNNCSAPDTPRSLFPHLPSICFTCYIQLATAPASCSLHPATDAAEHKFSEARTGFVLACPAAREDSKLGWRATLRDSVYPLLLVLPPPGGERVKDSSKERDRAERQLSGSVWMLSGTEWYQHV